MKLGDTFEDVSWNGLMLVCTAIMYFGMLFFTKGKCDAGIPSDT